MNAREPETLIEVQPAEFQKTIGDLERDGYRVLMIKPADAPREALLQRPAHEQGRNQDAVVRVVIGSSSNISSGGDEGPDHTSDVTPLLTRGLLHSDWAIGRAGMMYRDLIPDRLGGKLIASHIRIVDGGPVPDRVHFHKVDFQLIYCLKGAIRVVYEDQGPPFWLRPGDCVLQPPEIRHRVLEAEAGSEVIEITSPAEHETWFDHDMELPTGRTDPARIFGYQTFVRHQNANSSWESGKSTGSHRSQTPVHQAGPSTPDVYTLQADGNDTDGVEIRESEGVNLSIVIGGRGIYLKTSN